MEDRKMTLAKLSNKWMPSVPSWLDRYFEGDLMDWNTWNFTGANTTLPAVNVKEKNHEYLLEVAAPGMKRDDFKVSYDDGRLTIASEKKEEVSKKEERVTRREFSYQSFQRSFTIPEDQVNAEKISARYSDGILYLTLPKREEVKPKPVKEIKIS
jgi:HSP20 family protein